jgi:nucleotide-binding universal stress UspA family protein
MSTQENGRPPRIVAGVDGSPSSVSALRWAIRQAELTGATVDAVIAWHYPAMAGSGGYGMAVPALGPAAYQEMAEAIITKVIGSTRSPASDVRIRQRVTEGGAAQALTDASAGADLLVVGSRGHGGLTEAILGSVSQHCVQHATCPVVVTRG